jgi:hypothetical protein
MSSFRFRAACPHSDSGLSTAGWADNADSDSKSSLAMTIFADKLKIIHLKGSEGATKMVWKIGRVLNRIYFGLSPIQICDHMVDSDRVPSRHAHSLVNVKSKE